VSTSKRRRSRDQKREALDGRLERRERHAAPPRVPHPTRRRRTPPQDGPNRRPVKKSPGPARVATLAQAWAAAQSDSQHHARLAARALAREAGSLRVNQLDSNVPNRVVADWRKHLGPRTLAIKARELRRLLAYLIHCGAPFHLMDTVTRPKYPGPRTVIATQEELAKLLAYAPPWQRCWLELTAVLGMRFAEARRLCRAHFNPAQKTITFPTKGNRTNTLPATDELQTFFRVAPRTDDPNTPLIDALAGREMTNEFLYKRWYELKAKAGVNPQLRPHDLRRTLAVSIYDLTKDIRAVQQTLGHQNLLTTCLYLEHHDPANIRPILAQLRPSPDQLKRWTPPKGAPTQ